MMFSLSRFPKGNFERLEPYEWKRSCTVLRGGMDSNVHSLPDLMLEICCSTRESVRICGQEIPTEVVKSRFLKLNSEHIGYVMDSLKSNTAKIGNIKAYTLAALYNAPVTMGQYYTSLVSHDMAHGLLDG